MKKQCGMCSASSNSTSSRVCRTRAGSASITTTAASTASSASLTSSKKSTNPGQSTSVTSIPGVDAYAKPTHVDCPRSTHSGSKSVVAVPSPTEPRRGIAPHVASNASTSVVFPLWCGPTMATLRRRARSPMRASRTRRTIRASEGIRRLHFDSGSAAGWAEIFSGRSAPRAGGFLFCGSFLRSSLFCDRLLCDRPLGLARALSRISPPADAVPVRLSSPLSQRDARRHGTRSSLPRTAAWSRPFSRMAPWRSFCGRASPRSWVPCAGFGRFFRSRISLTFCGRALRRRS